jgi:4-amino-4-deoxychorismate lyase
MYRFIETVRIEHGGFQRLDYHNRRLNAARRAFFPGCGDLDLSAALRGLSVTGDGRFKCRLVYGEQIEKVEVSRYVPRKIESLRCVAADDLRYMHKFADRSGIEQLLLKRAECDDILIIKKGLVTDTSYSNVALYRNGQWYTPETCLRPGTMRQFLIDSGRLLPEAVDREKLHEYEKLCLINAMLDLGEIEIDMKKVL